MTLTVNGERLRADLERLGEFGRRGDGSVNRPAFSAEDAAARRWFADRARLAGLQVDVDGLLNVLISTHPRNAGPAVWTGSHLDTVPDGGMFDGALGAVAGLECVRRMHEAGVPLDRPVVSAAFADEEGAYVGFLGSKALAHGVATDDLEGRHGADGRPVLEAIAAAGGDPTRIAAARLPAGAASHFVELHIEQGPTLEVDHTQIGVVTGIVGINRGQVRFGGRPDHAGTTPMHLRRDALRGAGALLEMLPEIPARIGRPAAVITCGRVTVHPGAENVVPETAVLHLDIRDVSPDGIEALESAVERAALACGARHGLAARYHRESSTAPTDMDPYLIGLIDACATDLRLSTVRLPSGAGHDAQVMARLAPTGMIFVPSRDGRSHSRLEATDWQDVENGANVLLHTLLALAGGTATLEPPATSAPQRGDAP